MTMTVTAIDEVPLLEDGPHARASYRMTVSAGGATYHLLFTIIQTPFDSLPEGLTLIHSHSWDLDRALVPRHLDFGDGHPLYRLVFSTYVGDRPTLPVVISDRRPIIARDEV
jgi:hypothetical protein